MRLFKAKKPAGRQRIGLGDAVEVAARPVVIAVKAVTGKDLSNCIGCQRRKKDWNEFSDRVVDSVTEALQSVNKKNFK